MTLTGFAKTFKKLFPYVAFVFVVALFISLIFLRTNKTPQTDKKDGTPGFSPPLIKEKSLQNKPSLIDSSNLESISVPKNLPPYEVKNLVLSEQDAKIIAQSLGFPPEPSSIDPNTQDGNQYSWKSGNKNLVLGETNLRYTNTESESKNIVTSEKELEKVAFNFLLKIPKLHLASERNVTAKKYFKFDNKTLKSSNAYTAADVVEFSIPVNLTGYTLVDESPQTATTRIRLKKDGEVILLDTRYFEGFLAQEEYGIKSLEQTIGEVKLNKGKIVYTAIPDENNQAQELFRVSPVNIENLVLKRVNLAYLYPDELNGPIQPIYIFEGNFTKDNQTGLAIIYLPAY